MKKKKKRTKRIFLFMLMLLVSIVTYAALPIPDDPGIIPPGNYTPADDAPAPDTGGGSGLDDSDGAAMDFGISLLDTEIDDVIFETNLFLTDPDMLGATGPFFLILQLAVALAVIFALITCGGMAYKMILRKEAIDVMKLFKPFAVSLVLFFWYPPSLTYGGGSSGSILQILAYIPNAIGSYTHDLYFNEAATVSDSFEAVKMLMKQREDEINQIAGKANVTKDQLFSIIKDVIQTGSVDPEDTSQGDVEVSKAQITAAAAGVLVFLDKILMTIALMVYRIGWWGTIYCQQIILGMLTIFGPIQWAFSLLNKWEGAWAKWTIRYLTVHFYGAMLFFVGFYVLLLFDIVIQLQLDDLQAVVGTEETMVEYIKNAFFSSAYLMVASVVSLKCLNLVPDLAAWMIPEGETAFSTRNFGEGVASSMQNKASAVLPMGLGKMV